MSKRKEKIMLYAIYALIVALLTSFGWGIEWVRWTLFCNATHTHISFWAWLLLRGN